MPGLMKTFCINCGYSFEDGKLIVKEMMDLLCLEMVEKNLVSDSVTLQVGYSRQLAVESSRGTASLDAETNADIILVPAVSALFERIANPKLAIHRINISVNHVIEEEYRQYSMFTDVRELERNRKLQTAMLDIKKKFGKNAILKGINLQEASTMQERNQQIGGHKSGIYKDGGNKSKERGKEKEQRFRALTAVSLYCSLQPFICPRGIWAPFGHHLRKKHHENRG